MSFHGLSLPDRCPACGTGYASETRSMPAGLDGLTMLSRRYNCGAALSVTLTELDPTQRREAQEGCTAGLKAWVDAGSYNQAMQESAGQDAA